MKIFLLVLFSQKVVGDDRNTVIKYLNYFGYLDIPDKETTQVRGDDFREALTLFQLTHNLEISGEINDDLLNLMKMPRCGVKDRFRNYSAALYKWNKKYIKWHYKGATKKVLQLTDAALNLWQKYIDIKFAHDSNNPDILITNKRRKHKYEIHNHIQCPKQLYGKGNVLVHAFFPNMNNNPVEIHMDDEEFGYLEIDTNTQKRQINLFEILPPTPKISVSLPTSSTLNEPVESLCRSKNIDHLLFAYGKLYIFYKKWMWIVDNDIVPNSQLITNCGEIVIIVDKIIYMIHLHTLQQISGFPKTILITGL
ncbi:matrix metalloproteinase-19-like [Schistocerca nitens]|uniref:matrix metalloproteinase-19-like n=1 Tax=Schistocerca nitens TaxID=7011 RepID=UPI00211994B7|nr:matrix metalloproteinase-19-like [Schistocerca nitens]